jgi:cell division protein FtsL
MRRALALLALSLFVSLVATAVMTIIARPDTRAALRDVALRRSAEEEEEAA